MQDISKDIIIEAAKGDLESFEEIYRASSGFVYSVVLRIANNRHDAEEVTQEVFIKIYKNLKNFKFESSFKTWIYRIAVNAAINTSKKIVKGRYKRSDFDVAIQTEPGKDMTREVIERKDKEKVIASLLGMLNSDQRTCMVLRAIQGLSYKEIAEALKININTVRSRLKRAKEILLTSKRKEVIKNEM